MNKHFFLLLVLAAVQFLPLATVHAEKADASMKIETLGDEGVIDQIQQQRVMTGNVVLTQGSLTIKGAKLISKTAPDGTLSAVMYAPVGGIVTIRQKRDGGPDLWMEGEAADRITYDQKTFVATLISKAKVRRMIGAQTTDECSAAYISYDGLTEIVKGFNDVSGISQPGKDRMRCISEPRGFTESKSVVPHG